MKKRIAITLMLVIVLALTDAGTGGRRPLTVDELISLGESHISDGNYEQALVQFQLAIMIDPMNPRGYTGATEAYVGLGDIDGAIETIEDGQQAVSDDAGIDAMLNDIRLVEEERRQAEQPEIEEQAEQPEEAELDEPAQIIEESEAEEVCRLWEIDMEFLSRLSMTFGQLTEILENPQIEETNAGYYAVWGDGEDIFYVLFYSNFVEWLMRGDSTDWEPSDSDEVFFVNAPLGYFMPNMPPSAAISQLMREIADRYDSNATVELIGGADNIYFFPDWFVRVRFSVTDSYERESLIQIDIALDGDTINTDSGIITRDSATWISNESR